MKKAEILLTQFWVITFIPVAFNFNERKKNFIESVLGNNLQNW